MVTSTPETPLMAQELVALLQDDEQINVVFAQG
jgi:hypothetical protein